jgi:hypothetical protein
METFWVTIESEVLESIPQERIAWDAHSFGVDADTAPARGTPSRVEE